MATSFRGDLPSYLLPASGILGVLGITSGIQGLINPQSSSDTLGIPLPNGESRETAAATPFVSFVAARNISGGLVTLAFAATGNKRAAGTWLLAGTVTSFTDAWIVNKYGGSNHKVWGHAVLGIVIGSLGAALYNA